MRSRKAGNVERKKISGVQGNKQVKKIFKDKRKKEEDR